MEHRNPEIQTMKISEVKSHLSSLVNAVYRREMRIIVEKSGIPVAALVSVEDLARLERLERERQARSAVFERMQDAFEDVPPEEIEREVVAIIREMRLEDEQREERWRVLDAMRAPFRGVHPEEIERETAKAIAEVRAEQQAEREAAKKA